MDTIFGWTLFSFIDRALEIHGEKYDYSEISHNHIKDGKSLVPITCKKCKRKSYIKIENHIIMKSGCARCFRHTPYTLEVFLIKAIDKHGNRYDYSLVKKEHIRQANSKIPIRCLICNNIWNPTISSHINNGTGCPKCSGKAPYTLERFLSKAYETHGNKYDYSLIKNEDISRSTSKVPIRCITCNHIWTTAIASHINSMSGCPKCGIKASVELRKRKTTDDLYLD